jgi:hypothetical protein
MRALGEQIEDAMQRGDLDKAHRLAGEGLVIAWHGSVLTEAPNGGCGLGGHAITSEGPGRRRHPSQQPGSTRARSTAP